MIKTTTLSVCLALFGVLSFSSIAIAASSDVLLKSDNTQISLQDFQQFLAYKKIDLSKIPDDKRINILKALYLRDRLIQRPNSQSIEQSKAYQEKVTQFKHELLAEMKLNAQVQENIPDFSQRAKELYQADREEKYTLLMRYHVHFFELTPDQANKIHQQFIDKTIDLGQAQQTTRSGGTRWINKKNVSNELWQAAQTLSNSSPLSQPVYFRDQAWLLYFLDKKPQEIIPFSNVKGEIEQTLIDDYQKNQQSLLIKTLSDDFNKTDINQTLLNQL